ncbi:MAG: Gfo/Idh/MocA family protein [Anaerolineae bacterium]|jgi:predicted dehydrogenase
MSDKIRIGFIGAGNIARGHAMRLHQSGLAQVVGLADPSEQSLAKLISARPELADVPTFSDYREMLDKLELDAVEIHSPHCFHPQQILDSLDAGKHVLCEKPLTSTVAEAHKVIAKRDETGKVLMISYQRHFVPAYRYMRDMAVGGKLGDINTVALILTQNWMRNSAGTWRQNAKLSCGGQLNDSGSHVVDMMLWCTGLAAKEVFAQINNFHLDVDVDSAITVRFDNGAIGNVTVLGSTPGYWEMFGIYGSEGSVMYDNVGGLQQHMVGSQPERPSLGEAEADPDLNFVRAILGEEEVQVPAECGLRVIELTEAAWRSAELNRPVEVAQL